MFRIEPISKTSPRGKLPANEKIGGYDCHFVSCWRHENQEAARGNAQLEFYKGPSCTSLCRRRNLTSFCNVCEAVPKSLFWAPNGFNELPEVRFEFPFILIGKLTMAFLTGQSWHVLKSWYTGGAQNKDFGAVS